MQNSTTATVIFTSKSLWKQNDENEKEEKIHNNNSVNQSTHTRSGKRIESN